MKAWLLLLAGLALGGCSTTGKPATTQLLYGSHMFTLPDNIFVIAPAARSADMLIFKYGPEQGKKYLAFSRAAANDELDFGCPRADFFAAVFTRQADSGCAREALDEFRKAFVDGRETGVWRGNNLTIYFSVDSRKSFLFTFDQAGRSILIDTDFLSRAALRRLVDSAL